MSARHVRIVWRFWKNSLLRELSFRGHFILDVTTEIVWVAMMLVFLRVIYLSTATIRGWSLYQYLFLTATHLLVTSLFEAFFFNNCWRVSELVRTGDLDFVLLRPASAQFLLSFERVNYSSLANIPLGVVLCIYAANGEGRSIGAGSLFLYTTLIGTGVMVLYSLLFMFAVTSVWMIRQMGLEHIWFYAVNVARYPAEIYRKFAGGALWFILVYILPVLLVANLPANVAVRTFRPSMVIYLVVLALVLLVLSAVVFRWAMRWYRSASS